MHFYYKLKDTKTGSKEVNAGGQDKHNEDMIAGRKEVHMSKNYLTSKTGRC